MFITGHEVYASCGRFSVLLTNFIVVNGVRPNVDASAVIAEKPGKANDLGTTLCDVDSLLDTENGGNRVAALLSRIVKVAS
jgi:hypothetical protein